MKTAATVGTKWQLRAGSALSTYAQGARDTQKDQSSAAIAAKANWFAGLTAANAADRFAKGLSRSGKQGWLSGVLEKGQQNYGTGVAAARALTKYTSNSGKYDAARGAAAGIARGPKGSAGNLQRVAAVVTALRAAKTA